MSTITRGDKPWKQSSSSSLPFSKSLSAGHAPRIALINIMDNAESTERHFTRTLLAAAPAAEITLCRMACAKLDTKYFAEYECLLNERYRDWHDVIGKQEFDLVIVTGINRGKLSYEELARDYSDFWDEACELFDTLNEQTRAGTIGNTTYVCWSAFAAMKALYGIEKGIHDKKFYGLFPHKLENPSHPLIKGFSKTEMLVPHSRYSYLPEEDLRDAIHGHKGDIIMNGPDGPAIWTLESGQVTCFINHLEYSLDSLAREYNRDSKNGKNDFPLPHNYDPASLNDPHLVANFAELSKACATFYSNLVKTSQQKLRENRIEHCAMTQPTLPIGELKLAFGS